MASNGFVVLEANNCFASFYFVINVCISHVIITLIRYFLIAKSRDLVSLIIPGLKNGPGSRGIAIPYYRLYNHVMHALYYKFTR